MGGSDVLIRGRKSSRTSVLVSAVKKHLGSVDADTLGTPCVFRPFQECTCSKSCDPKVTSEIHRIRASTGTTYHLGWETGQAYIFLSYFLRTTSVSWLPECASLDGSSQLLNTGSTSPSLSSLFPKWGHFPGSDLCARQNWGQTCHILLLLFDMVGVCFLPSDSSSGNSRRQNTRLGVRIGFRVLPYQSATSRMANTSETYSLTVEKAGSPTSRCQQSWVLLEGSAQRETPSHTSPLVVARNPWLGAA